MLEEAFESWTEVIYVEEIPVIFAPLKGLLWDIYEGNLIVFDDWHYLAGMSDKEVKKLLDSGAVEVQFKIDITDIKVIAYIKDVEAFDEWVLEQTRVSKEAIDNEWRYHMLGRITRCFYDAVHMLWNKEVCLLKEKNILKKVQTLADKNLKDLKGVAKKTLKCLKGYEAVLDRLEHSIENSYKDYLHDDIRNLLDEGVIRCDVRFHKEDYSVEVITYICHQDAFMDYAEYIGLGYEDVLGFLEDIASDIASAYNWWGLLLRKEEMLRR